MSGSEVSGVDLARQALLAAREAARKNGATSKKPKRRTGTVVRRDGREPLGLGSAIGMMMTERGMAAPAAGGSVLANFDTILAAVVPELAGRVQAVAFDAETGRLDVVPDFSELLKGLLLIDGAAGDPLEGRDADEDWRCFPLVAFVKLGDLLLGCVKADGKPLHFAEPALALRLGNPVLEVVPNLYQARSVTGAHYKDWTTDASVLVIAVGAIGPTAFAQRELASCEVAQEILPLLSCHGSVLFRGSKAPAASNELPVCFDGLDGIDGRVSHGRVDIGVTSDDLCDVRRETIENGVCDEDSPEVMRHEPQRVSGIIYNS
ncbi:hypothetical protein [Streptomyces sp. NPDC088755]|uniref:hypothetical protein n=1 Tax=Streptomyces sp. NPDC088755 TaxID=3365888 RepID=UPI00382A2136